MQTILKKKFFLTFLLLGVQLAMAQKEALSKAELAFDLKEYAVALTNFENYLASQKQITNNQDVTLYFKAAFCASKLGQPTKELYFLSKAYSIRPRRNLLEKLNQLAVQNGLSSYDNNNIGFLFVFFRKYTPLFAFFLLLVGVYVCWVLIVKARHGQMVQTKHKSIFAAYLISVLVLLNLPDIYKIAIIQNNNVHLRSSPSAASVVVASIPKGEKIDILGQQDVWYRIFWQNQISYIRTDDVAIIE